jgi:Disulphide bond corrector protein DsbC
MISIQKHFCGGARPLGRQVHKDFSLAHFLAVTWCHLVLLTTSSVAQLKDRETPGVTASLVRSNEVSLAKGQYRLGVLFTVESPWHVYWKYPGAFGRPTEVQWGSGEFFTPTAYPQPRKFRAENRAEGYGYTEKVIVSSLYTPPKSDHPPAPLSIQASWAACSDTTCNPGRKTFTLEDPLSLPAMPFPEVVSESLPKECELSGGCAIEVRKNSDSSLEWSSKEGALCFKDFLIQEWFPLGPFSHASVSSTSVNGGEGPVPHTTCTKQKVVIHFLEEHSQGTGEKNEVSTEVILFGRRDGVIVQAPARVTMKP